MMPIQTRPNEIGVDGLPERLYKYFPLRNPIEVKRALRFLLRLQAWFGAFESWEDKEEGTHVNFRRRDISRMMINGGLRAHGQSTDNPDPLILRKVQKEVKTRMSESTKEDLDNQLHDAVRESSSAFCLSISEDDPGMWDEYGASGNGVSFELKPCGYLTCDCCLMSVNYEDAPSRTVDHYNKPNQKVIKHTLATKGESWSDEKEWRLFVPYQLPGRHELSCFVLTGVTLGYRTDDQQHKLFERASKKRPFSPHVTTSRIIKPK